MNPTAKSIPIIMYAAKNPGLVNIGPSISSKLSACVARRGHTNVSSNCKEANSTTPKMHKMNPKNPKTPNLDSSSNRSLIKPITNSNEAIRPMILMGIQLGDCTSCESEPPVPPVIWEIPSNIHQMIRRIPEITNMMLSTRAIGSFFIESLLCIGDSIPNSS